MMKQFFTIESVSLIVTVISMGFGFWQYHQNRKTRKLITIEAMELHNNVSFALGAAQAAKTAINNGQSPNIEVGRAEGLCQAILHESVKLYCNLANTSIDDINNLLDNKQLNEPYRSIYYSYSNRKKKTFKVVFEKFTKTNKNCKSINQPFRNRKK